MISVKKMVAATVTLGLCVSMLAAEGRPLVEITLVSEGKPSATIVVGQNPSVSARLAALELQYHIRKITGAVVPIRTDREEITGTRILVGQSKQTNALGIKADGFKSLEYLMWNYFHHPMEPAVIGKWNCFPCFMPDVISREVKRYHKDGIRGVFLCGIGQQLDYYLHMQTAFDVNTDYQEVVDEFFALYFGGASEPMKTFYYRISEINREEGLVGTGPEKSWAKLGTPERMKELGVYIDEAVKLAKTDIEKRRVETWKRGVWEYMNVGHRQFYPRAKE